MVFQASDFRKNFYWLVICFMDGFLQAAQRPAGFNFSSVAVEQLAALKLAFQAAQLILWAL
jgi:hypothetical protein